MQFRSWPTVEPTNITSMALIRGYAGLGRARGYGVGCRTPAACGRSVSAWDLDQLWPALLTGTVIGAAVTGLFSLLKPFVDTALRN